MANRTHLRPHATCHRNKGHNALCGRMDCTFPTQSDRKRQQWSVMLPCLTQEALHPQLSKAPAPIISCSATLKFLAQSQQVAPSAENWQAVTPQFCVSISSAPSTTLPRVPSWWPVTTSTLFVQNLTTSPLPKTIILSWCRWSGLLLKNLPLIGTQSMFKAVRIGKSKTTIANYRLWTVKWTRRPSCSVNTFALSCPPWRPPKCRFTMMVGLCGEVILNFPLPLGIVCMLLFRIPSLSSTGSVLEDMAICMSKCAPNVENATCVGSGVSWTPDGLSLIN